MYNDITHLGGDSSTTILDDNSARALSELTIPTYLLFICLVYVFLLINIIAFNRDNTTTTRSHCHCLRFVLAFFCGSESKFFLET